MAENNLLYSVARRLTAIEDRLDKQGGSGALGGIQILDNGKPFFQGGFATGIPNLVIYEPTVLPVPGNVTATWGSSGDVIYVDVSWGAPTGYGADAIASYLVQLYKYDDNELELTPLETTVNGDLTSTRFQPVEPNTKYLARVNAVSRNGRNSLAGEDEVTTGADEVPPAAPTGIEVSESVGSLLIKWTANTEQDTAFGKGSYRVVVSTHADLSSPAFNSTTTATVMFTPGLEGNTDYYVGVYAIDSSGNQSSVAMAPGGPFTPSYLTTKDIAFSFGGGNIIKNSGFEDIANSLDKWGVSAGLGPNVSVPSDGVYHGAFGNKAVRFSGNGDYYIEQTPTLTKGTWVLSCWVKADAVTSSGGAGVILNNETISGTTSDFEILMGTPAFGGRVASAGLGTFDWKRLALRFNVTSSTASFRIYLQRGGGGACNGNAWFDEVQLEQGDTITGYAPRPDEILTSTIKSTMIGDNEIITSKLAAFSVVAGKVAANTIGTNELQAVSITTAKIAAGAVTTNELTAGAVTTAKLAVGAVEADRIAANAVTTAKLAADSVQANQLAAMQIGVSKYIQGNYNPGVSGWRIDGAGNAEFNTATIRGSLFSGGTIQIADRIFASPSDSAVHLAANVEIGKDYSGTVYSGDLNWGLQVGNNGLGARWTHLQADLSPGQIHTIGFFDTNRNREVLHADSGANVWKAGPDGSLWAEKVGQQGDWGSKALIVQNGSVNMNEGNLDHAGIGFHARAAGVASILQLVAPVGQGLEVRTGDNAGFAPLRASAFLTSSSVETKNDVSNIGKATVDKFMQLRPVRFKRSANKTKCAVCRNTGKVLVDNYLSDSEESVKLVVGAKCPLHPGKTLERSPATKAYEDSDFLGLLAEEVGAVIPALCGYVDDNGITKPDSVDPMGLIAMIIAHVQSLTKQVEELSKK